MSLLSYIKGLRRGKEAHRIERNAMDDPFLFEALEGFDVVEANHAERIERMQRKLAGVTTKRKPKRLVMWSAAATFLLLISVGGYLLFRTQEPVQTVAQMQNKSTGEDLTSAEYADTNLSSPTAAIADAKAKVEQQQEVNATDKIVVAEKSPIASNKDVVAVAEEVVVSALSVPPPPAPQASAAMVLADEAFTTVDTASSSTIAMGYAVKKQAREKEAAKSEKISASSSFGDYMITAKVGESKPPGKLVTGKVVDDNGEPLPYVTIAAKGTKQVTTTDDNGNFTLSNVEVNKLVASYIGYDSKEQPIDTTRPMLIALNESNVMLSEVVVAYGSNRMENSYLDEDTRYSSAEPIVGYRAYRRYLKEQMVRPTGACAGVTGKVVISFRVNSSGRPYNLQVKKSLCTAADQEAIRLIQQGCDWTLGDKEVSLTVKF